MKADSEVRTAEQQGVIFWGEPSYQNAEAAQFHLSHSPYVIISQRTFAGDDNNLHKNKIKTCSIERVILG